MAIKEFDAEVAKQLDYYVYRLIDPRTGLTFYVGKGKGNRIFDHIYQTEIFFKENKDADSASAKIQQIKSIQNEGLEVIHVIHRWGLTEKEAFEVEAALIDAYGGLTNLQGGHCNDRGIINAKTLNENLSLSEYDDADIDFKYLIIKINEKSLSISGNNIYEAVRKAWKIKIENVSKCRYVFAVLNGVVKKIYENVEWYESKEAEGRFEFTGTEVVSKEITEKFCNMLIPKKYRQKGSSNPILYSNKRR